MARNRCGGHQQEEASQECLRLVSVLTRREGIPSVGGSLPAGRHTGSLTSRDQSLDVESFQWRRAWNRPPGRSGEEREIPRAIVSRQPRHSQKRQGSPRQGAAPSGQPRSGRRTSAGGTGRRVAVQTGFRERTGRRPPGLPRGAIAAAGTILALLIVAGSLGWGIYRRAARQVAGSTAAPPPMDEREARLLRRVQEQPATASSHQDLAAYYQENERPFEALWELAVAQELGAHDPGSTLRLAGALRRSGLPAAAVRLLSEARRAHPSQPSLDLALAQTYLAVAEPEAAVGLLRQNPSLRASPDGLLALARTSLALGDLRAARKCTDLLLTSSPHQQLALGRLALAMGDGAEARKELAAAAREDPLDEETQYVAGEAFSASGKPADRAAAIEHFKLATRADPHKARAGVALGRLLYEQSSQWEHAAEVYRQALAIDPRCVEAEAGLARVRNAQKQPGEAVYHLARVRELEERPEEALPLYRRWGELRPERWDSVLRAAECLMDMQRFLDAAREVERGLARYPDNPELYSHLTQLYIRVDSRVEAARLCERWARVDRSSGRPEWVRGQLAAKALRYDEAVRWFEEAIRKNPDMGAYHASLADALAHEPTPERLRHARAALERATTLAPGMALYQYQLGTVLQQSGDREGARQAFLRALDRDGERLDAYGGLMAAARSLGHPGAAAFFAGLEREVRDRQRDETAARRALAADPRSAGPSLRDGAPRLALARTLLRRGDLAAARNDLAVAAEQPDGAGARALLDRVERLRSTQSES